MEAQEKLSFPYSPIVPLSLVVVCIKFAQRLHNFHFCDDMWVSYRLGCVFLWTDSSPGLHWDHAEGEMLILGAMLLLLIGVADGEIFMA